MGIKLMIYRMRIKDAGMSNQGKVMDIELPVVDCPKPPLGKGAALQNCLECASCHELNVLFVDCDFQSKQQADQSKRNAVNQNRVLNPIQRPIPSGVFDLKSQR